MTNDDLERQKFEAWIQTIFNPILQRDDKGAYLSIYVEIRWESWHAAWQARANLEKSDGALINEDTKAGISIKGD